MSDLKNQYLIPIYVAVALAVGIFIGNYMRKFPNKEKEEYLKNSIRIIKNNRENASKFYEVLSILDESYVDQINKDSLLTATINDILHKLDPHSYYIPAEQAAKMQESIEGKFGGIGVRFFILRDTVCVTNVIQNTPAFNAGVKSGDKIIKIDSKNIAGVSITNEEIMNSLKGVAGKPVKFTVLRNKGLVEFSFKRGEIPLNSIDCAYMINDHTGYIKISQFSIPTYPEFILAVKKRLNPNMNQLILDLRNNGGGVMSSAIDIVDEFLPEKEIIVSAKGNNFKEKQYLSTSKGILKNVKLAVLINEQSASASEIVAGAIQDNDRGLIIGRPSFGKGLIQEDKKMKDGSTLRVTIARYFTPSGRCIQKPYEGLSFEEYIKTHEDPGFSDSTNQSMQNSIKFSTVHKKRTVFGGGGIFPDVVDYSTGFGLESSMVSAFAAFNAFAFDYLNQKRGKWKNFVEFLNSNEIQHFNTDLFYNYCEKEFDLTFRQSDKEKNRVLIKTLIIAEIARHLWDENEYYQVLNKLDPTVLKALDCFGVGFKNYNLLVY